MNKPTLQKIKISVLGLLVVLSLVGCGDPAGQNYKRSSKTSAEAADHLAEAFANSKAKKYADASSQFLKDSEYRKALASIYFLKTTPGITLEQGIAIRDFLDNLSRELSEQAEDGDPKAKEALSMLREISRN